MKQVTVRLDEERLQQLQREVLERKMKDEKIGLNSLCIERAQQTEVNSQEGEKMCSPRWGRGVRSTNPTGNLA
jgi:hypothetical protein